MVNKSYVLILERSSPLNVGLFTEQSTWHYPACHSSQNVDTRLLVSCSALRTCFLGLNRNINGQACTFLQTFTFSVDVQCTRNQEFFVAWLSVWKLMSRPSIEVCRIAKLRRTNFLLLSRIEAFGFANFSDWVVMPGGLQRYTFRMTWNATSLVKSATVVPPGRFVQNVRNEHHPIVQGSSCTHPFLFVATNPGLFLPPGTPICPKGKNN